MAQVTPALIKELRERTGAGMSDCKTALVESEGNIDLAVENILKKGIVKAAARAGKVAAEGEVGTWVSPDHKFGVIAEVNCQTDFVARGDDFHGFVVKTLEVAKSSKNGEDLNTKPFPGSSDTVDVVRQQIIAKTGENTVIRRWARVEAGANGVVQAYVHMGGKLAVLIAAEAPTADAAKNEEFTNFVDNCAMQIAAMNPLVVNRESVDEAVVAKQKEIYAAQLKEEGKPEAAWPKIIEGKVNKWFTEVTLLGQDNVWAPDLGTIDKVRQELGKKLGGEVKITSFTRFGLGDGIEKKTDDLAAEVAKMTGA